MGKQSQIGFCKLDKSQCQGIFSDSNRKCLQIACKLIIQLKIAHHMTTSKIDIKFNNFQEVKTYAQQTDKILLVHDDYILDATSFSSHHPGGATLLSQNNLQNISEQMKFHHPLTINLANSMAIGSIKKQITRIIDPNRAFLPQIWNLNHSQYLTVVNSPMWMFVPSPRMFQSDFLQFFTHTKWYQVIPMPWLIIALTFYMIPSWQNFNPFSAITASVVGFLFFTLVEYLMHRFLFHSQQHIPDNKLGRFTHFMLHGIHHMLPNDPDRLVFPPILALLYITIGYFTVLKVIYINDWIIYAFFWSFFLIGYMTYDVTHYMLHHIDTTKSKGNYFHRLQQYHNQHHFGGQDAGYGVSSKLWDIVFRTGFYKTKKLE